VLPKHVTAGERATAARLGVKGQRHFLLGGQQISLSADT
jgi:hypothetical protein